MTAGPILTPQLFTARDCAVWFEGREVTPGKAALIKSHLNAMARQSDGPTARLLDSLFVQLVAAGMAAVNQRREALRVIPNRNPPPRAA